MLKDTLFASATTRYTKKILPAQRREVFYFCLAHIDEL